jgi:predicted metal-dependent hydrolase
MAILINRLYRSKVDEEVSMRYRRFVNQPEFRQKVAQMRRQRGVKRLTSPKGRVFNLVSIFEKLNEVHFNNQVEVRHLSWSQRASRKTMGHFDSAHEAIIINKRLDNPRVPLYVISYVLYHEMLHAVLGEETSGGKRRIHHQRFKAAEKSFPNYSKAKAFIRDHYNDLAVE